MWKLQRIGDGNTVVLKISGRIEADGLSELKNACAAVGDPTNVVLDLLDLGVAGQEAVMFLGDCQQAGMSLRNCPAYIRDWIARERTGENQKQ